MSTETLRPNAAGDECNIPEEVGAACPNHYQNVDEAVADGWTTRVYSVADAYTRDLYNIADSGVGAGTINHITVYVVAFVNDTPDSPSLKIAIKSNSTVTEDTERTLTTTITTLYSKQWTTNPADSQAWEWADINALQVGIALHGKPGIWSSHCTQVYVEVDYTAAAEGGAQYIRMSPFGINIIRG